MIDKVLRLNANQVEAFRLKRRLTQKQVADAGGIGVRTYSRIASVAQGKKQTLPDLRLSTIDSIAQALGVKGTSLLVDD